MDTVGDAVLVGHSLYARAGGASSGSENKPSSYKIIGLVLAIASGLFIGVSFVLKKHGLLKANEKYNEEAGEGYGYLKNVWWWSGMTLMIIGEICNFAAYLFADAILVTPLGALAVVITAILSSIFLKERLSFVGKVGCFCCIVGSVVIAANAPEQRAVENIQNMQDLVIAPGFLSFAGVILVGCTVVALWAGPRYGKKTMLVYLTVCSLIGGLSVSCIQGIGAAITAQARGEAQFNKWFTYVLLIFVIATLVTEVIFLNVGPRCYHVDYSADSPSESVEPVQRRACYSHLLRVFHLGNHRHISCSLSWLQGLAHPSTDRGVGLFGDLRGRGATTAIEVCERCARHRSFQRRS